MWLPGHKNLSYPCLILVVLRPLSIYAYIHRESLFANPREMEDDMENAVMATQILANLGIFLGGIGLIWLATLYKAYLDKKE